MINQEKFEEIEMKYGCGYWNVCEDHACSCSPTAAVSQGYNPKVYASMQKQQENEFYDDEEYEEDGMGPCG